MYLDKIQGEKIAIVGNPSSMVGSTHLVDTLVSLGLRPEKIFCPEHGFRGSGEAGELIQDYLDPVTHIPVISLYGSKKKPLSTDLDGLDYLVFDIQDVGARFYTYISTLHYVMEAAAEHNIRMLVLDRPNPNGFYIDGPIRKVGFESFVGMHPIPVVHGMTIGEYAQMINGEAWLTGGIQANLTVIPCLNYDHQTAYDLPIKPSPNLPNQTSVYLYPSLCFFEGTTVSVGRGTPFPFQVIGHPDLHYDFTFLPQPVSGASLNPKWKGVLCHGIDLRNSGNELILSNPGINLDWLIAIYNELGQPDNFFNSYFDTLAGGAELREMIQASFSADDIKMSWRDGLDSFRQIREKYLLYPDNQVIR